MMMRRLGPALSLVIALAVCVSSHESTMSQMSQMPPLPPLPEEAATEAPTAPAPAPIKCRYDEELRPQSCDGTCDNPTPDCLFPTAAESSVEAGAAPPQLRCSCAAGKVRISGYCRRLYNCYPKRTGDRILTQCQLEDRFDSKSRIACDESGLFFPKQLGREKDRCVHRQTGRTIPGKQVLHGQPLDCEVLSVCQQEWVSTDSFEADNPGMVDGNDISCNENGNYYSIRCYSYTGNCRCVVPETGTTIPGLERISHGQGCRDYTSCQLEFIAADVASLQSNTKAVYPKCSPIDGSYELLIVTLMITCDEYHDCRCSDWQTGIELPGHGVAMRCEEMTKCQKQVFDGIPEENRKVCDGDGRFATKQFAAGAKYVCVDADTGKRVEGTDEVPFYQVRTLKCPEPSCPSNMVYSHCAACESTCITKDLPRMCQMLCESKCTCPGGQVYDELIEMCVDAEDCFSFLLPPPEVPSEPESEEILIPPPMEV